PQPRAAVTHLLLTGAAALLLLAAARTPGVSSDQHARGTVAQDSGRFDGEYGLFVRLEDDSVRVGWITARPGRGMLQVIRDGEVRLDTTTRFDSAHTVAFRRRGNHPVVLRYGSADDVADRHETTIDPRTGTRRPPVSIPDADSIFVLGDVHGEYDTLTSVLHAAGVVDDRLHWSAGHAQLVVLGDVTDRGADVTRSLWLLYRLEREAADAGGHVHLVLGNHEIMVMLGDLRYVAPKERAIARLHGVSYDRLFDPRHSLLGRWLASRPALIRIEDVLFAHGGVAPIYLSHTLHSVDDSLAAFAGEELFYRWADTSYVVPLDSAGLARRNDFFWDSSSIFWFRGYAQSDTLGAALDSVLDHYGSTMHVVGHTPGRWIRQAYGGRVVLTNTLPFGVELLRLVRHGDDWQRMRIGTDGGEEELGAR
ncbi:MAG: metallophosphoesterase, partial [Longimicrobiales bacterium]